MEINVATNISNEHKNIEVIIKAPELNEQVKTLVNLAMNLNNQKGQVLGTKDNKTYILAVDEIICFYSEGKNNYCRTRNGIFRIKEKLYELENTLKTKEYVRISNSCIINLNYVESFDSSIIGTIEVIFKDGTKEYVSRRRVSEVMKKLREWGN